MDMSQLILRGATQPINFTAGGAGDTTVRVVGPGKRFIIFYLHLEASATVDLIVKSGATPITGAIAITASQVYDFEAGGAPVLSGSVVGDDLILNVSAATDVDGWAYLAEVDQ
jgi:hypothetical protein